MEQITIYKRSLRDYMFVNYVLYNTPIKSVNIILNDIVSDDIGDIVQDHANKLKWDNCNLTKSEIEINNNLHISSGLKKYLKAYKNENLLYNFHRFILVGHFKKMSERMKHI